MSMKIPKKLQHFLQAEIDPAFAKRAQLIFESIARKKPKKILDAGCGRGFYTHAFTFFSSIKEIHAIDINEDYLKIAQKHTKDTRVTFHKSSLYSLPFPNNYFDCIIFSEILEHLPNEAKALKELKRVLKQNGTILITVPNENFPFLWDPINWVLMKFFNTHIPKNIWWLAGIWADHQRLYTKERLTKSLEANGFILLKEPKKLIQWSWPFAHFLLYGIGKNIVERMPKGEYFNRFAFQKPKIFSIILAFFMHLPSNILDRSFPHSHSVNLFVEVKKTPIKDKLIFQAKNFSV